MQTSIWDSKIGHAFLVAMMLVSGVVNTVSKKVSYQTSADGVDGSHRFEKPWFSTLCMFIGEFFCLFLFFFLQYRKRRRENETPFEVARLINSSADDALRPDLQYGFTRKRDWFIFVPPCLCDLTGTTLSGIALVLTTASVYQMLRGSILVFTAILSVVFLKRRLRASQVFGILVVVCGLIFVGVASVLNKHEHRNQSLGTAVLGNSFIVIGQLVSAIQFVIEEKFVKKRKVPPLKVVGGEGMFGTLFMICIVLPVLYFVPGHDAGNRYENSVDSMVMIGNSATIAALISGYICSIAVYNYSGLTVTHRLSALHRCLIDACRTILVWGFELLMYYEIDAYYGEPWTDYSYLQLIGFALMVAGTFIYNRVFKFSCCEPSPEEYQSVS
eukprot:ANDGO_00321.mRNA.1 Uncharacterized protein C12G12.12